MKQKRSGALWATIVIEDCKTIKELKHTKQSAKQMGRIVGRELSFSDVANELIPFRAFLQYIRKKYDATAMPQMAVVVAYHEFRKCY
jgi:hypothetical protein